MAPTLPHERGSLRNALSTLAAAACNLTTLVARPDRRNPFNYVFYVEFVCEGTAQPLDVLRNLGSGARLPGVY
jgi:prephenate dehydratase